MRISKQKLKKITEEEYDILILEQRVVDPTPEEAEKARKEHEELDRKAVEDDARVARTKRGWKNQGDEEYKEEDTKENAREKARGAARMKTHSATVDAWKSSDKAKAAEDAARRARAEAIAAKRRGGTEGDVERVEKIAQAAERAHAEAAYAAAEKKRLEQEAIKAYDKMRLEDKTKEQEKRGKGQYDPTPIDPKTGLDFKLVKRTGYTYEHRKNPRTGKVQKVLVSHTSRLPKHVIKKKIGDKYYFYNSKTGRIYRVPKRYR